MYPNLIDHYRVSNMRNEVRPDNPVPPRSLNSTSAEQCEFFEMYYLRWRDGEEFDKAGTGCVNYKPAPLSDIYDSYCKVGFLHPVLKRTFIRELEQLDFEYLYGRTTYNEPTDPGMDMSFTLPRRNTGPDDEMEVKLPTIKTFPLKFEHADPVIRLRKNIVESVLRAIA